MKATFDKDDESGVWEIELQDAPEYCRALSFAPPHVEQENFEGIWLILLLAVWSVPDRYAIEEALDAVALFEGKVQLGIMAFDEHAEIQRRFDRVQEKGGSPIWLFMRNGELVMERVGSLQAPEVTDLLQSLIGLK